MKKVIVLFFLCISVVAISYSQTKQESIRELIHIMKNDSLMNKTIDSMLPAMMSQMKQQVKDSAAIARSQEKLNITKQIVKEMTPKIMDENDSAL
ncbi:MAG: hypothetical protein QM800_05315 [Paludibacter sp.]